MGCGGNVNVRDVRIRLINLIYRDIIHRVRKRQRDSFRQTKMGGRIAARKNTQTERQAGGRAGRQADSQTFSQ